MVKKLLPTKWNFKMIKQFFSIFMTVRCGFLVAVAAIFSFILGCSTPRGPQPEFAKFADQPDLSAILADFRRSDSVRFTERQTAVLDSKRGRMAAIGVCSFDKKSGAFALALMTPTGVKLLQVAKVGGQTTSCFYLPGISPGKKAGPQIAEDAWRIYAHPDTPPVDREIRGDRLILNWKNGAETESLIFGRSADSAVLDLKTKMISVDGQVECVIHYFKYRDMSDGTRRAELITYENRKFDYFLTIKRGPAGS